MKIRHLVLVNKSIQNISFADLSQATASLQTQLDRDFTPLWGVRAQIVPLNKGTPIPPHTWPIIILDNPKNGLGIHLDKAGKPFAEVEATNDWSVTGSHEMLEMLVDPLGHRFIQAPDIDPDSDGHLVYYLQEVGDPCEIFEYSINGVAVSDFVTPDYYDPNAGNGMPVDFLGQLSGPFDVPQGGYISWIDPQDGRWHQKQVDGSFVTARKRANLKGNARDDRDTAFGGEHDSDRHRVSKWKALYGRK